LHYNAYFLSLFSKRPTAEDKILEYDEKEAKENCRVLEKKNGISLKKL
jgi:hypothetical protein